MKRCEPLCQLQDTDGSLLRQFIAFSLKPFANRQKPGFLFVAPALLKVRQAVGKWAIREQFANLLL